MAKEAVEAHSVQGQDPPEGDRGQAETWGALAIPEATVSHPERSLAGRKKPSSAVFFWKLQEAQSHMSPMLWSPQRKPTGSRGVSWGDKAEQREVPEKPPWKLWEVRKGRPPSPRSQGPHGDRGTKPQELSSRDRGTVGGLAITSPPRELSARFCSTSLPSLSPFSPSASFPSPAPCLPHPRQCCPSVSHLHSASMVTFSCSCTENTD